MAGKYRVRSISLPSRSHPSTCRIEEELNKLSSWEAASTSSSESVFAGLSGLVELYTCLDDLLNMASTQEVLSRCQSEKCLEELLEGSVRLLDVCSTARDMMLQFREQVQALQSALRRRKGDSSIPSYVACFTCFRKKMTKDAKRMIGELRQMDSRIGTSMLQNQDSHLSAVIRALREVTVRSSSIFQSLLLFLSTPSKPKQSRWSLVSRLIHNGVIACEENMNELESVDAALTEVCDQEKMQGIQKRVKALEISVQDFENCLEQVFRRLIKTRTSLLNIISQ